MSGFNKVQTLFGVNPLIEKATSDNDTPTPGYLYSEICKLTYQGAKDCERLKQQLLAKLRGTSPAVRIKVLIILKHLLDNGHPHFQSILKQRADEIRPCLDFRAPNDPLHGDAPARLVREKANIVINALYETRVDASLEFAQPPPTSGGPNTGTGSTGTGSIIGGKGPTSIEGPKPPGQQRKPGIMGVFRSSVSPPPQKVFKPVLGPVNSKALFTGVNHTTQSLDQAYADAPSGLPGRPRGGWDNCDDTNNEDTVYEDEIVSQICNNANNKSITLPTRQQLNDFLAQMDKVNTVSVAYYLGQQLSHQNWRNRLRALYVIHELISTDVPYVKSYFSSEGYATLAELQSSVQKTIRDKVGLILANIPVPTVENIEEITSTGSIMPPDNFFSSPSDDGTTIDLGGEEEGTLFANLSISTGDDNNINQPDESLFFEPKGSSSSPMTSTNNSKPSPVVSSGSGPSTTAVPPPSSSVSSSAPPMVNTTTTPNVFPFTTPSRGGESSSEKLLTEIFTPSVQNKVAEAQNISTILNTPPPTYPYPYPNQPYQGFPSAPIHVQYYPTPYTTTPGSTVGLTQGYPYGLVNPNAYVGMGSVNPSESSSTGGAFEFVAKENTEKKDPFDFIKVGQ